MSGFRKILRGLLLLCVILVLAVLVWQFTYPGKYYYYGIGGAVLVSILVAIALFRFPKSTEKRETVQKGNVSQQNTGDAEAEDDVYDISQAASSDISDDAEQRISVEEDYTDIPPLQRKKTGQYYNSRDTRPNAVEVTARYRQMAGNAKPDIVSDPIRPSIKAAAYSAEQDLTEDEKDIEGNPELEDEENIESEAVLIDETTGEPPVPLIEDETSLTKEDINNLVNAVWYRCENPYCKYTSFLTVHHIVDEKDGGTNKLDNLIVLCPYCHDLAHRNEMPVEEMSEWIANREERFKSKLEWHYF